MLGSGIYLAFWNWNLFSLLRLNPSLQALKSSTEVELVDERIRCKTDPERWPIPTPTNVGSPRTDFSQLINCPEFVPRQTFNATNSGQYPNDILSANLMMLIHSVYPKPHIYWMLALWAVVSLCYTKIKLYLKSGAKRPLWHWVNYEHTVYFDSVFTNLLPQIFSWAANVD